MLSLLTLEKLVKLEFVSLYQLCEVLNVFTSDRKTSIDLVCLRSSAWSYFRAKDNPMFCSDCVRAIKGELCNETFVLSLPMPRVLNPNRFVKSSFGLLLLWTTKLYSSLRSSYKKATDNALYGQFLFDESRYALSVFFTGNHNLLSFDCPDIYRYIKVTR